MRLMILPDGNRRWAKERGLSFDEGYAKLPERIAMVVHFLLKNNIHELFMHCVSPNNLKRPFDQVKSFFNHFFSIQKYVNKQIKLRVIVKGNKSLIPEPFRTQIENLEKETAKNTGFKLYYFIGYSTIDDLERATSSALNSNLLSNFKDIYDRMEEPEVDVILRTGSKGRHRLSAYTPLKSPNAEIIFVDDYFPDISEKHIQLALDAYQRRQVNDGK